MMLARSGAGMVVFKKAPHLAKRPQILDLDLGKLPQCDARTAIELMVQIDRGLRLFDSGRFPNRLAVHQQLQVVRPRLAGSGLKYAKEELRCTRVDWQRDRVFRPASGSVPLPALHFAERKGWRLTVLRH